LVLVVQIIDNNLSQPYFFSKSVSSSIRNISCNPYSGLPFGILGMIAAVPLYTILKVIGKNFSQE
jgi:predicted PurR-regulated permease PerM